jgi:broad-specificity NMP kinase
MKKSILITGVAGSGKSTICKELKSKKYHEVNLAFWTKIDGIRIKSKESHLQFFLFSRKELVKQVILPEALKKAILKWFRNKKIFWVSQKN